MFNLAALEMVRSAEIEEIIKYFRPGFRILEIGAGTGQQARTMAQRGLTVEAIEIAPSPYTEARVFPIVDYDGRHIPYPDASFDVVFSSNVLEHVTDPAQLSNEIQRVLKPGGFCIHLMPTHTWRLWTSATSVLACFQYLLAPSSETPRRGSTPNAQTISTLKRLQRYFGRHGERGNVLSELWLFHPKCWRKLFRTQGYDVVEDRPVGIFYTGNTFLGLNLQVKHRRILARFLGSACHLYKVIPARQKELESA